MELHHTNDGPRTASHELNPSRFQPISKNTHAHRRNRTHFEMASPSDLRTPAAVTSALIVKVSRPSLHSGRARAWMRAGYDHPTPHARVLPKQTGRAGGRAWLPRGGHDDRDALLGGKQGAADRAHWQGARPHGGAARQGRPGQCGSGGGWVEWHVSCSVFHKERRWMHNCGENKQTKQHR